MRMSQWMGLNDWARSFVETRALRAPLEVCPHCQHEKGGTILVEELEEKVIGMFPWEEYPLHKYRDSQTGRQFEEYKQFTLWSSGPMIHIALKWSDTGAVIIESMWEEYGKF